AGRDCGLSVSRCRPHYHAQARTGRKSWCATRPMTRSSLSIRFSLRTAASIRTAKRCGSSRRVHTIAAPPMVERYGASVWTPPRAAYGRIPNPATTDELPAGIEALELERVIVPHCETPIFADAAARI